MVRLGKFTRRALLAGTGAVIGVAGTKFLKEPDTGFGTSIPTGKSLHENASLILNDASGLNETPVSNHLVIKQNPDDAMFAQLRSLLADARERNEPFCTSAARHSQGGQSLPRNGIALTLEQDWLEPDVFKGTYRVSAGMRWHQVIEALDRIGWSPKVMQSNHDFGVASTFCVNAHGWPVPFSAMGSTVRSIKLMLADGALVTCSRMENQDLFNLSMGGYGLTGIITELEIEMVPNVRLVPRFEKIETSSIGPQFVKILRSNPTVQMAYGRLDISLDNFLETGLLISYVPDDDQSGLEPAAGWGPMINAARYLFRSQLSSERNKQLRWWSETRIGPVVRSSAMTRNSLVSEPVGALRGFHDNRTDILHEYFVAPERFADFIIICQEVIPSSFQQLLNITLRYVDTDQDSVLAYATEPRIAAVMLFSQEKSTRAEADMARMTSVLIEQVIAIGGTYYLPYRLHASRDQFYRGYRHASEFVERKRAIDPGLLFRNAFWEKYMAEESDGNGSKQKAGRNL